MSNFYLCTFPRCGTTVPKPGKCPAHRKMFTSAFNKMLSVKSGLYGTARWKVLRLHILADEPICVLCHEAVATEVDHIEPYQPGDDFFNPNNLQSLCKSCHSSKTQRFDRKKKKY